MERCRADGFDPGLDPEGDTGEGQGRRGEAVSEHGLLFVCQRRTVQSAADAGQVVRGPVGKLFPPRSFDICRRGRITWAVTSGVSASGEPAEFVRALPAGQSTLRLAVILRCIAYR